MYFIDLLCTTYVISYSRLASFVPKFSSNAASLVHVLGNSVAPCRSLRLHALRAILLRLEFGDRRANIRANRVIPCDGSLAESRHEHHPELDAGGCLAILPEVEQVKTILQAIAVSRKFPVIEYRGAFFRRR